AGMAGCKFKVGGLTPEEDAGRVEAARKAAGAGFILAVDANRGWSADDAIRFARLIEPLDVRWFEEPCHWYDDAALMARVRPVPHGTYAECFADPERDPVWQTMWTNRPAIKDGMMDVAQGPGFGLILDEGLVRRYRAG